MGAARALGGALTLDDLKAYRPVERQPLHVRWEGHDVYTMPPPSAGGVMLAQTLGMYSLAELKALGKNTGAYHTWWRKRLRGAIADRMRFWAIPIGEGRRFAAVRGPRLAERRSRSRRSHPRHAALRPRRAAARTTS